MDDHLAASSNLKWLIIGGDHNSHIGYGGHWDFAEGTKGPFGMGRRDNSGTDFLQWCEDNNLCFADSFVRMEHRGTWFSRLQAKWYELDGFVLKNKQRRNILENIEVINEDSFSDHRPKMLTVKLATPGFTVRKTGKSAKVDTDKLRLNEVAHKFREKIKEKEEQISAAK